MADFYVVHAKALQAASGRVRVGDEWCVPLREVFPMAPLRPETIKPVPIPIVRFTVLPDHMMQPSSVEDGAMIADWNERHKNTPAEAFDFPRSFHRRMAANV